MKESGPVKHDRNGSGGPDAAQCLRLRGGGSRYSPPGEKAERGLIDNNTDKVVVTHGRTGAIPTALVSNDISPDGSVRSLSEREQQGRFPPKMLHDYGRDSTTRLQSVVEGAAVQATTSSHNCKFSPRALRARKILGKIWTVGAGLRGKSAPQGPGGGENLGLRGHLFIFFASRAAHANEPKFGAACRSALARNRCHQVAVGWRGGGRNLAQGVTVSECFCLERRDGCVLYGQ